MKIRAIITGATGMVGEGVLLECLRSSDVEAILVLGRKPIGIKHRKLREVLHADFQNLSAIENELTGYNACFFCAGISSVGVSKPEYERITHDLTLHVAHTLVRLSPEMTFEYVSGDGTDSREQSRSHWARVKGRTENELLALPFRQAYMFRPGLMRPVPGQRNVPRLMRAIAWFYPVVRRLAPAHACELRDVGQAMIAAVLEGYPQPVLEVADIVALAHGKVAAHSRA
ncbi:NAD-dependent epimerase/dehydratase family protein [Hymenobacter terrenus]|uniref:NAD-dependent epimerase/dehydratase family protein n=1 Tax=Hymenobacter terrenus TaxID=1629124 RepID=UPI000619190B|nr:NAD-dependent epimerase/dehydratase family protein [Hymenobacter terrenus]